MVDGLWDPGRLSMLSREIHLTAGVNTIFISACHTHVLPCPLPLQMDTKWSSCPYPKPLPRTSACRDGTPEGQEAGPWFCKDLCSSNFPVERLGNETHPLSPGSASPGSWKGEGGAVITRAQGAMGGVLPALGLLPHPHPHLPIPPHNLQWAGLAEGAL